MPDPALLDAIRAVVGERGLLTDAADTAAYIEDWRRLYRGRTPAVIRPASTDELAQRGAAVRGGAGADRAAGWQHLDGRRRDAGRGRQRVRAQPRRGWRGSATSIRWI